MAGTRTGGSGTNELADLVGPFWSEAKVCDALGIGVGVLAARRAAGAVLGLTTSDVDRVYPVAQFRRNDGSVEVKPALVPLFQALRGFDPWTVAVLLHTPASELDDQTPFDWVRDGGAPDAVASLAQAVAREWASGSAG